MNILCCSVVFVVSNVGLAYAETEMQRIVCDMVMPSLLEFTGSLSEASELFNNLYNEQMDAETKEVFESVSERNNAMKLAAEEFRREFVLACYGSN